MSAVRYINPSGLPRPYAIAVEMLEAEYDAGECDFSATALTSPARIHGLKTRLKASGQPVIIDVAESSHSIVGTGVHKVLEVLRGHPDYEVEQRFFARLHAGLAVDGGAGLVISAKIDGYEKPTKMLFDWKGTRFRTYSDGVKFEYAAQLNIGKYCIENGVDQWGNRQEWPIEKLSSIPIYRDYSAITCEHKPPHEPVGEFDVPIWPREEVEKYILKKAAELRRAEEELPLCSSDEMWETAEKWAVEPKAGGRARRLLNSYEEAESWRENHKQPKTLHVVHRPGSCHRCRWYCPVASVCSQWAEHPSNPINKPDGGDEDE